MALVVPDALLSDVKNYLDITWADAAQDRKVLGFIREGMNYLNNKLGVPADYEEDGDPRTLLFDYVRYARDGARDVFEANYKGLILAMQNRRSVKAYAEETVSP